MNKNELLEGYLCRVDMLRASEYGYLIPSKDKIIENVNTFVQNIVYFEDDNPDTLYLGRDCKGLREPKNKTIYIRNSLDQPLKDITTFHEFHHAAQTNPLTNNVGINQHDNVGRLIMEAQTQYFAELGLYCPLHSIEPFEERCIPSSELRMDAGGTVVSRLHNYEQYDALLSKLALFLGVSKDFFVCINFAYDEGMEVFKKLFDSLPNPPFDFDLLLFTLDYYYVVDLIQYVDNRDKETLLSGGETRPYPCFGRLSRAHQYKLITAFDSEVHKWLKDIDPERAKSFHRYILDDSLRGSILP